MTDNYQREGFSEETSQKGKIRVRQVVGSENRLGNEISEMEIFKRLKLYHQTSKEKWEAIQKAGAILSEKELLKRGLISEEQLEDFETTSTGSLGIYGDVTLEIDLDALNLPGAKVATAGDWLHFVNDEDDERYFHDSEISASEFVEYLTVFLKTLPDPEWFWGKSDLRIQELISQGMREKIEGDPEKIRQFWKLHPEIMFSRELPLKYVKNVKIEE